MHVTKAAPIFQYDSGSKPIRLGLSPDEAHSAIKEITSRIETYDRACQPAVTASKTKNEQNEETADAIVTQCVTNGKMLIVTSALEKAFHEKYRQDLKRYSNATDLLKFIGQIFGKQNDRQRQAAARQEVNNAARRIHDNEPFCLFLDRLTAMAKSTSKQDEIRKDIIDNAFRSNLTPALNMFLLEHDKLELDVTDIAQFLDQKQKHKRSSAINALQIDRMEAMEKMIMNLTQLVQQSLTQTPPSVDQNSTIPVEINHVQKQNRTNGQKSTTKKRCAKCGMFNHKTADCSGKCRIICRRCQQQGHLEAVCRMPKNE